MFQFPAFASYFYVFKIRYRLIDHCKSEAGDHKSTDLALTVIKGGFPHSEIVGSKLIRNSPTLIAAYHVLHRLCMPRHSPDALKTLDHSHCRYSFFIPRINSDNSLFTDFDLLVPDCQCVQTVQLERGIQTPEIRKDQFHEIHPIACG